MKLYHVCNYFCFLFWVDGASKRGAFKLELSWNIVICIPTFCTIWIRVAVIFYIFKVTKVWITPFRNWWTNSLSWFWGLKQLTQICMLYDLHLLKRTNDRAIVPTIKRAICDKANFLILRILKINMWAKNHTDCMLLNFPRWHIQWIYMNNFFTIRGNIFDTILIWCRWSKRTTIIGYTTVNRSLFKVKIESRT